MQCWHVLLTSHPRFLKAFVRIGQKVRFCFMSILPSAGVLVYIYTSFACAWGPRCFYLHHLFKRSETLTGQTVLIFVFFFSPIHFTFVYYLRRKLSKQWHKWLLNIEFSISFFVINTLIDLKWYAWLNVFKTYVNLHTMRRFIKIILFHISQALG